MVRRGLLVVAMVSGLAIPGVGRDKKKAGNTETTLARYIANYAGGEATRARPAGSLWNASSVFADLSADARAAHVNDLVTIRIVESTLAQASADVSADRKLSAQSGISAMAGKFNTSGISSLFSPQSQQTLTGKGQSNSQTTLRTSVGGRVAAVLPNGVMVLEAERSVRMNNETQTIVLRGMVRPADVFSDNTVLSTALSNLEIELKGKGVVSDSTRPPNKLVRALLWVVGF
jgi:flagellar L-ring protein precursor FlgH